MRCLSLASMGSLAIALCFASCGGERPRADSSESIEPPKVEPRAKVDRELFLPTGSPSSFFPSSGGYDAHGKAYRARFDSATGALTVTAPGRRASRETSLELQTETIARDRELWRMNGTAKLDPTAPMLSAGRVELPRGRITETLVASADAIEQTWAFPERPDGHGDLVIRVRASGGSLRSDGDKVRAEGGISYRDATWVDARGKRTPLRATSSAGTIVIRVPAHVVDESSYPAMLDPTIGPELSADLPIVGVHDGSIWGPKIRLGKSDNALVVWSDYRVRAPFNNSLFSGAHLFGARITPSGTVLDTTGIAITAESDFDYRDWSIAYDGAQNWFVASMRVGLNSPCNELWGALVSDQGTVLSSKQTQGACTGRWVSAGFDGTSFVVGYDVDHLGTHSYYATRFSTAGAPLDPQPKLIATGLQSSGPPRLACRPGGGCLAAWASSTNINAVRIGPGLSVLDATPIVVSNAPASLSGTAFDGVNWVVGWGTQAARIDPATGTVQGSPVTVSPQPVQSLASDGTNTWFAWSSTSQVQVARMSRAGALLPGDPRAITTSASADLPEIAVSSSNAFVTWQDLRVHQYGDVYAGRIATTGAPLDGDGFPVSKSANTEQAPAVATSGSNFLVAWTDYRASTGTPGVYAARLAADGTSLDAAATLIDPQGAQVSLASDGTDYLATWARGVYWYEPGPIRLARISGTTGAVIGAATELTATNGRAPSATHDGSQYVVAWYEDSVRVARVSNAGSVIGSPVVLPAAEGASGEGLLTGVASNGTATLVIWQSGDRVRGVRIDKAGVVLDATPIAIGTAPSDKYFPRVTWDGIQWVVVWEDYRAGFITDPEVFAARISADGTVLSPNEFLVGTGPAGQVFPAVVGMNDGYSDLVVWSDNQNPARYQDFALKGGWIRRSDGKLLDGDGIVLSDRVGNEIQAALAPAGNGRALVVYQATDYSPGMGTARIRARFIGSGTELGKACAKDSDCITRVCSDGTCCDRACSGTCETCLGTGGTCSPVVDAEDPDTCGGENVCSATSTCKRKLGRGCTIDSDCVSGACSGGICCERACNGPCEACAAGTGACTLRPPRNAGAPSCAPFACDGTAAVCPAKCTSEDACPFGSRCDRAAGVCVSGGTCVDDRTALLADESSVSCAPYTCTSGACRTSCRSVADCLSPYVCNENGQCVPPISSGPASTGGCSAAPAYPAPTDARYLLPSLLALAGALVARRRARAQRS